MTWASSPRRPTASSCNMPDSRSRPTRRAQLFADPHHPYTAALLAALPERANRATAARHSRRGARPDRPADRLPVLAALRLRLRPLPPRGARARLRGARPRALPYAAGAWQRRSPAHRWRRRAHEPLSSKRAISPATISWRAACSPRRRASRRSPAYPSRSTAGHTLAVVGESGCGKSTLARLLTLIEKPTSGALMIDGEDVADADAATRRRLRQRDPDRLPEPLWLAQSAPEGRQGARRAAARQHGDERARAARPPRAT